MIEIDTESLLVSTDTDISVAELEAELSREGFTLNFHAIPSNDVLLLDVLNERLPNLYGEAFGGIEDLCLQVRLARDDQKVYQNRMTPRSATGPSLKNIAIGSKEMLGIPVQATLKIFYQAKQRMAALALFPGDRPLNAFLHLLKKNRIFPPLLSPLSEEMVENYLEEPHAPFQALGLAVWGESEPLRALLAYLRHQTQAKKGDWIPMATGSMQDEFMKDLGRTLLEARMRQGEASQKNLSPTHFQLAKQIREIL